MLLIRKRWSENHECTDGKTEKQRVYAKFAGRNYRRRFNVDSRLNRRVLR